MAELNENALKKIMPHSDEAEQSVLGAMILDKSKIAVVSEVISGEDFSNWRYGIVFDAMVELNNDGIPVDIVTLQNKLKEKDISPEASNVEFIKDIMMSGMTSANAESYARIVSEKAVLRRLINLMNDISNNCYQEKDSLESILEDTEKRVFQLVSRRNTGDFTPIKTVVMQRFQGSTCLSLSFYFITKLINISI